MQQHADAANDVKSVAFGMAEKSRFKRHVNKIGSNAMRLRHSEINRWITDAIHTERRGIDDERRVSRMRIARGPRMSADTGTELANDLLRPIERAIVDANIATSGLKQPIDDSAR